MVAQNMDRMVDSSLLLHDSASAVTADALATVGGVAAAGILDIGSLAGTGTSGGTSPVDACFDVVCDVSACDVASADEGYNLQILGSNSSSFASGVALLGNLALGSTNATTGIGSGTGGLDTAKSVGRHIVTVRNRVSTSTAGASTVYRYVRLNIETRGTTPSITLTSFISKVHVA
jgi:cytolysin (calcineurin-like family phosphatase)